MGYFSYQLSKWIRDSEVEQIKQRLMLIMGYMGAVIGAGFASGREIVQFFINYGSGGLKGAVLTGFLFAACGGLLLYIAHLHKVSNYQDFLTYLLGEKVSKIVDFLLAGFLFLGLSTMLSASGAVFHEHLYLPKELGVFLACMVVLLCLFTGKRGLIYSFNLLVPLKLILLITITSYAAFFIEQPKSGAWTVFLCSADTSYWILASLLYVAYNFALAMVVLTEYQSVTSLRGSVAGAIWGGAILGLLVVIYYLALSNFLPEVVNYEVPMLYIAGNISIMTKYVYTVVLWIGILTTALANGYGFCQRMAEFTGIKYSTCLLLSVTLALPVAMQSFSVLIARVYPVFGLLGLIILLALIYKSVKQFGLELYYNIIQLISRIKEV